MTGDKRLTIAEIPPPRIMPSGALRWSGEDAMREVRQLVDHDPDYTWAYLAWPGYWIDVYPYTIEARERLLGLFT